MGVLIESLGVGLRAVGDEQVAAVAAAGGPDHEVADRHDLVTKTAPDLGGRLH